MPGAISGARVSACAIVAAAFIALAVVGCWRAFDGVWTSVGQQRLAYRGLTPVERQDSAAGGLTDMRVIAFWAAHVRPNDRYYLNVPVATTSNPTWGALVSEVTGYFLVPATQVTEPGRATVVLSWGRKPARAGLRFASSARVPGVLDAVVSRVAP